MKYITILLLVSACGDDIDKRDVREPETIEERQTSADRLNAEAEDSCHLCNPGNEYGGCFVYDDDGGHEQFFYYVDRQGVPVKKTIGAEKAYQAFDQVCG